MQQSDDFARKLSNVLEHVRPQMGAISHVSTLSSVVRWIDVTTKNLRLPTDERSAMAIGCFDVSLEHHASISLLHELTLHGSALALLRVQLESNTRGMWLTYCATDSELKKFREGKIDKKYATLLDEIEKNAGLNPTVLSGFKSKVWNALNGFTHTGFNQVVRRFSPGRVGANYPDDLIYRSCAVSGAFAFLSVGQLVRMSGDSDLLDKVTEQAKQFILEMGTTSRASV